jgi:hemerythrin-like domain-containing protein
VPYTAAQRRLFNAMAHNKDIAAEHDTSESAARKLAEEADRLKREGKEKKASVIDLTPVFYPNGR